MAHSPATAGAASVSHPHQRIVTAGRAAVMAGALAGNAPICAANTTQYNRLSPPAHGWGQLGRHVRHQPQFS
ncbi:MAG: hypothetical protein KDE56_31390, partial [Anaerolineales bacterium]|nr:hypothetical protein [Anaerolineales bacterium]